MIRRVIAAVVALVLAAVGAILVINYANRADERALADQETVDVLVATEPLARGVAAEALAASVELRAVPRGLVTAGSLDDLDDVAGRVLTVDVSEGEQLVSVRFADPEDLRSRGTATLPEEIADLHQVTVPLDKARALGGDIAPGDTVGVFMSFDASQAGGVTRSADGTVVVEPDSEEGGGGGSISMTHLTLHKVVVVRVEGAYVAPPLTAQDGDEAADEAAEDTVFVTLAVEAADAERLVFGMEWGQVWLSLEPQGADESGTEVVVVTIPNRAEDVYE